MAGKGKEIDDQGNEIVGQGNTSAGQGNMATGLYAIHQAMGIVCRYVEKADLLKVSLVCKTFRTIAQSELKSRHACIQRLCFTYKDTRWPRNLIRRIPSASLVCYETDLERRFKLPTTLATDPALDIMTSGFEEEILEFLKMLRVRNKKVVLTVDRYHTTEDIELRDTNDRNRSPEPINNIMGIFFFNERKRFNIRVAAIPLMQEVFYERMDIWEETVLYGRIVKQLCFDDDKFEETYPTSMILMVALYDTYINLMNPQVREFFLRFKKKCKDMKFASIFGIKLVSGDYIHSETLGDNSHSVILFRISGQSLQACSEYIHCRTDRITVENRLYQLREKWQRETRDYHIGLVYSLICTSSGCNHVDHPCSDNQELMRILRCVFPEVKFSGYFIEGNPENCPVRYSQTQPDQMFDYIFEDETFMQNLPWHTSIVIISYN